MVALMADEKLMALFADEAVMAAVSDIGTDPQNAAQHAGNAKVLHE